VWLSRCAGRITARGGSSLLGGLVALALLLYVVAGAGFAVVGDFSAIAWDALLLGGAALFGFNFWTALQRISAKAPRLGACHSRDANCAEVFFFCARLLGRDSACVPYFVFWCCRRECIIIRCSAKLGSLVLASGPCSAFASMSGAA